MAKTRTKLAFAHNVLNPTLGLLLRSPLHRIVSGGLVLITVTGRRSGKEFTFPVNYQQDGEVVRIGVGWPEQKQWWRNLRGAGAPVRLRLRGQARSGHGVVEGNERDGVVVVVTLEP